MRFLSMIRIDETTGRHVTLVRATKRLAGSIHKFEVVLGSK